RERLHDRESEPLEARWVGECRRSTVDRRQLVVRDVAEQSHALCYERPALPACVPDQSERQLRPIAAQESEPFYERREVLARLESRDGKDIRPAEILPRALGREDRIASWLGHRDPLRRYVEQLLQLGRGEVRVGEEQIARASCVLVLRGVHR